MENILNVSYAQNGSSTNLNAVGMREMQARAFAERNSQYLLIKAPPACGKSRALMFLGLDKLMNQGLKKVIVSVPEMSIGSSFKNTDLIKHGFFADWAIHDRNNLCINGGDSGKVEAFKRFMASDDQVLVCTHATLRFAFDKIEPQEFNDTLVAIDEFHHVSADENSRLGNLIDVLMKQSTAHIVAMTGSYFRGDTLPILMPEDEALFTKVTYTYYEQLNGYQYLKSLGIGYHFYQGQYFDALPDVLDPFKKTIIHIPNVNSSESSKDKYSEVDAILDVIGEVSHQDHSTGIYHVKRKADGKIVKVANLVDEGPTRANVQEYLRNIKDADDMDFIIALGMAKEGFDWPYCEHVLTIGYRGSMTEVVQIIGRATRDCEGKVHAQFTNLIAQPDAQDEDVKNSVNNMLKAITTSLLMEQILAPTIKFKPRSQLQNGEPLPAGTIIIDDTTTPVSPKVLEILNGGKDDIIATLLLQPQVTKEAISETTPAENITQIALPKVIQTLYPDLTDDEQEQVRSGIVQGMFINSSGGVINEADLPVDAQFTDGDGNPSTKEKQTTISSDGSAGGNQFVKMGEKFINIENLNIDLIDSINPFHGAYEILSKSVTAGVLKTIQEVVTATRADVSEDEAIMLWPRIKAFRAENGREPSLTATDQIEQRLAVVLAYIRRKKQEAAAQKAQMV
jgi:DNA or RNA helicases of superfamily II